jgi:Fe-S oxidoreductase
VAPSIEFPGNIFFYLIVVGFSAFFLLTVASRIIPFLKAKGAPRFDQLPQRISDFLLIMIGQSKFFRRKYWYSGILHPLIFWGFLVLLIRSLSMLLAGVADPLSLQHLPGGIFNWWKPVMDAFNVLVMVGIAMASYERFFVKPQRLTLNIDAWRILGLIFFLMVTDILANSFELHLESVEGGTKEAWSFVAYGVSGIWSAMNISADTAGKLHAAFWYTHLTILFVFLCYLPFCKHSHVLTVAFNVFFRNRERTGVLQPINIEAMMENAEEGATFGVGKVTDFNWKALLDFMTCTECGRCQSNCPAYLTDKELSPKEIEHHGRMTLMSVTPTIASLLKAKPRPAGEQLNLVDTMGFESIWDCVTCGSCMYWCPVCIEHVPEIIDVRRYLVMDEARMPETAQATLMQIEQRGHPWRGTQFGRSDWMQGLDVPLFDGSQEYLLWVGCSGSLSERNVPITQALARLLLQAGVSFGVLGEEEPCCGDPARRLGNEYLFQMQAQQAIEIMKSKGVKKIVTACPHGYNTMRNEYPQFDGKFEVEHHTELLDRLVREGKLQPKAGLAEKIVYHDSCYLARHNEIDDAPRHILESIPQAQLTEMERSRKTTFCCGAGGGHMWVEESKGRHINHARTEEAMATGAKIVATACPFCIQMFEDGIPALEPDEEKRMRAMDVAELLDAAVGTPPPARPAGTGEEVSASP